MYYDVHFLLTGNLIRAANISNNSCRCEGLQQHGCQLTHSLKALHSLHHDNPEMLVKTVNIFLFKNIENITLVYKKVENLTAVHSHSNPVREQPNVGQGRLIL
jgi:hypothetical protein